MTSPLAPTIEVAIHRENRRTLSLQPKPGLVVVKAPHGVSEETIANFLFKHQALIRRECGLRAETYLVNGQEHQWEAAPLLDPDQKSKIHRRLCHEEARMAFANTLSRLNHPRPPLRVGAMASAWGKCHSSGRIELHWRVGSLPAPLADYVICHELAHLRHLDHSRAFWTHLADLDPQARQHDRELSRWHL